MKKYNIELIESVKVVDRESVYFLAYEEPRKSTWYRKGHNGRFYDISSLNIYSEEEIKSGVWLKTPLLIDGKTAYYHPYVKVTMVSGDNTCKNFETKSDAIDYAKDLCRNTSITWCEL